MYRALIADDEEMIRRGIARFLSMDREIEVVGQAEDGESALKLAGQCRPDLLFVDINMPFLNGLEFIERLNPQKNDFLTIIITGYDDFEYARQALRLGVFDYQLKPIMEESFFSMLARAKKRQKEMKWAKSRLEKDKSNLISELLSSWLDGRCGEAEALEQAAELGLSLPDPYGVTVIRPMEREGCAGLKEQWDESLLFYAMENIAREIYEPLSPILSCRDGAGDLVLLSSRGRDPEREKADGRFKALLKQYLLLEVCLARGTGSGTGSIPEAYRAALDDVRRQSSCSQMIRSVLRYIEEKYPEETFSLQDVADFVHVSPQHLSRMFRSEMHTTFMDYVTARRMRTAAELLHAGNDRIYEIAQKTGYSSQHYFSSAFKRVMGVSPVDYRKSRRCAERGERE